MEIVVVGTGRSCHSPRALKTLIKRGKEGKLGIGRIAVITPRTDLRGDVARSIEKAVTFLDESAVSLLIQAYRDGAQMCDLATRFGIHRNTVKEHLVRHNVPIRRKGLSDRMVGESVRLYENGLSLVTIGKKLGVNPSTIRNTLIREGVVLRSPNAPRRRTA